MREAISQAARQAEGRKKERLTVWKTGGLRSEESDWYAMPMRPSSGSSAQLCDSVVAEPSFWPVAVRPPIKTVSV